MQELTKTDAESDAAVAADKKEADEANLPAPDMDELPPDVYDDVDWGSPPPSQPSPISDVAMQDDDDDDDQQMEPPVEQPLSLRLQSVPREPLQLQSVPREEPLRLQSVPRERVTLQSVARERVTLEEAAQVEVVSVSASSEEAPPPPKTLPIGARLQTTKRAGPPPGSATAEPPQSRPKTAAVQPMPMPWAPKKVVMPPPSLPPTKKPPQPEVAEPPGPVPVPPQQPKVPEPQLPYHLANLHHYVPSDVLGAIKVAKLEMLDCAPAHPRPTSELRVCLAASCMKRGWQMRAALGPSLLHIWRHRYYTTYVLALVKDPDREWVADLEFIQLHFSEFMRPSEDCALPLLVVALADPTGDKTKGYFHQSVSKNTSHQVAFGLRANIVCNLDVDNVIGPGFMESLLGQFLGKSGGGGAPPKVLQCGVVSWRGYEGATTGRVACSRHAWEFLNGYDEDCFGSGSQDIDLIHRARKAAKESSLKASSHIKVTGHDQGHAVVGFPIENVKPDSGLTGTAKTKAERGSDKITNIDTAVAGKTWGQLNNMNWQTFHERLQRGEIRRNVSLTSLGWPFEVLQPAAAQSSAGSKKPAPKTPPKKPPTKTAPATLVGGRAPPVLATRTNAPPPTAQGNWTKAPPTESGGRAPPQQAQAQDSNTTASNAGAAILPPLLRQPQLLQEDWTREVRIVTLGSQLVCRWFQGRGFNPPTGCKEAMDLASWRYHNPMANRRMGDMVLKMMEVLDRGESKYTSDQFLRVYGTIQFNDPDRRQRGSVNHLGMHVSVLRQISGHPEFNAFFKALLRMPSIF